MLLQPRLCEARYHGVPSCFPGFRSTADYTDPEKSNYESRKRGKYESRFCKFCSFCPSSLFLVSCFPDSLNHYRQFCITTICHRL